MDCVGHKNKVFWFNGWPKKKIIPYLYFSNQIQTEICSIIRWVKSFLICTMEVEVNWNFTLIAKIRFAFQKVLIIIVIPLKRRLLYLRMDHLERNWRWKSSASKHSWVIEYPCQKLRTVHLVLQLQVSLNWIESFQRILTILNFIAVIVASVLLISIILAIICMTIICCQNRQSSMMRL